MWFTRASGGFGVWFNVEDGDGKLLRGLPSTVFTASIVNPQNSQLSRSIVNEGISGAYRFAVTPSFLLQHGTGSYGITIELSSSSPAVRATSTNVLGVFQNDLDNLTVQAEASVNNQAIADAVWNTSVVNHTGSNTFGEKVAKKLLTFAKFIGLK